MGSDFEATTVEAPSPVLDLPVIRIVLAMRWSIDMEGIVALTRTQPDLRIDGRAGSWEEAQECCVRHRPDVLLLDTELQRRDGSRPICRRLEYRTGARVLAVAPHDENRCAVLNPPHRTAQAERPPLQPAGANCLSLAVSQGARGTIRRNTSPEQLYRAIRTVAAGRLWLEPCALATSQPPSVLTPREHQVSTLVGRGFSNKEIGDRLGITVATVKKHLTHTMRKLGLHDRLQLGICVVRDLECFPTLRPR